MKKYLMTIFVLLLAVMSVLTGCRQTRKEGEYDIFYLNIEATKVVPISYKAQNTEVEQLIPELLEQLSQESDLKDLRQAIPSKVEVLDFDFNGYQLTIDFSKEYYDMSTTEEILCRAAVVRTMLQIKDIAYVSFTVESEPLVNANGKNVGSMDSDYFVENPGKQINTSLSTTLTLYFASSDGMKLEKETRKVHYSSNISMEKLVMEQLLEGPKTNGLQSAIPTGTKMITISVVDNVCYVNLDETFRNQNDTITEQVVLYSIVDSLTELPSVNKVQISVNGDTKGKLRYNYELSSMYEADYECLDDQETPTETEQMPESQQQEEEFVETSEEVQ